MFPNPAPGPDGCSSVEQSCGVLIKGCGEFRSALPWLGTRTLLVQMPESDGVSFLCFYPVSPTKAIQQIGCVRIKSGFSLEFSSFNIILKICLKIALNQKTSP